MNDSRFHSLGVVSLLIMLTMCLSSAVPTLYPVSLAAWRWLRGKFPSMDGLTKIRSAVFFGHAVILLAEMSVIWWMKGHHVHPGTPGLVVLASIALVPMPAVIYFIQPGIVKIPGAMVGILIAKISRKKRLSLPLFVASLFAGLTLIFADKVAEHFTFDFIEMISGEHEHSAGFKLFATAISVLFAVWLSSGVEWSFWRESKDARSRRSAILTAWESERLGDIIEMFEHQSADDVLAQMTEEEWVGNGPRQVKPEAFGSIKECVIRLADAHKLCSGSNGEQRE